MTAPTIAVTERGYAMLAGHAAKRGLDLRFARINPDGSPIDDLGDVQAVFFNGLGVPVLRQLLRDHPGIRWVAAQNAGVDALMMPEIVERGVAVTRVRHVHDTYVGEFAMTCLLAMAKGLPDIVRANERQEWLEFQPARVA